MDLVGLVILDAEKFNDAADDASGVLCQIIVAHLKRRNFVGLEPPPPRHILLLDVIEAIGDHFAVVMQGWFRTSLHARVPPIALQRLCH